MITPDFQNAATRLIRTLPPERGHPVRASGLGPDGEHSVPCASATRAPRAAFRFRRVWLIALACFVCVPAHAQSSAAARALVQSRAQQEYASLFELYKQLHAAPELSFHEEKTAARLAEELRKAGFEVVTGVGRYGVVGVLRKERPHSLSAHGIGRACP